MLKRSISMFCFVLAVAVLCLQVAAGEAGAARFGGGKSFGGKSSYSRSTPAPQVARQTPNAQASRQQGVQPGTAASGISRSGMGGMLGGILAGTLLGSLLFGGAHAGVGMVDILLFALLGFMALKILRAVMGRRAATASEAPGPVSSEQAFSTGQQQAHDPWMRMRDQSSTSSGEVAPAVSGADIRIDDFDQDDFLRGAKILYTRLQESWDNRDVDDIATFTTPAILNEVRAQAEADFEPSRTEVMLINASLVSAEREGDSDVATVYFDVLLRESPEADIPSQVRELWHFVRPSGTAESWRLDGIQQVS